MTRRLATRWLPIAVIAIVSSLATAGSAHALSPVHCGANSTIVACQPQTAPLTHEGWVTLNLNYCPPRVMCRMMYRTHADAWRWTGRGWVAAKIKGGRVYVAPYTGQWRWVYSYETGWLAITGNRFELPRAGYAQY